MSFILDALKKSEAERNRQSGPTLIDMRIAAPRRRTPLWMLVLLAVLLANLVVLAIVLLRSPGPSAPAPAPVASAPAGPAAPLAPPVNVLPPPALPAEPAPAEPRRLDPPPAAGPAMTPAPLPTPLPTPRATPPAAAAPAEQRAADASLPSVSDLRLSGVALPELRLALHVYDANPANRYVLLNGQRMREGDSTGDGVLVERINEVGAVLSWRGQRFRLVAGE